MTSEPFCINFIPQLLQLARYDPNFIRRVLEIHPEYISFIEKDVKSLSFDAICLENIAGYIYPKVLLDKLNHPPLESLRFATHYENVAVFEAYNHFSDKFKLPYYDWELTRAMENCLTFKHLVLYEYLLTKHRHLFTECAVTSGYLANCKQLSELLKKNHLFPSDECVINMIHNGFDWKSYRQETPDLLKIESMYKKEEVNWKHIEFLWKQFQTYGLYDLNIAFISALKKHDLHGVKFLIEHLDYDLPDISEYQNYLYNNFNIIDYLLEKCMDCDGLEDFVQEMLA